MRRLLLLLAFLYVVPLHAQDTAADQPKVEKDIVFGKGGTTDLHLNLAQPAGLGPFPAVVIVHGGGWKGGSYKDGLMNMIMLRLAKQGYVAICIQYRLTPSGARFPSQIEDCKCAVRWLRGNAEKYQVDPNRIGAIGGSAGGHLVLLLGLTHKDDGLEGTGDLNPDYAQLPSTVQAVVNLFGPSDLTRGDWEPNVEPLLVDFLGGKISEKLDLAKKASPLTYIQKGKTIPPILTFHGTKDNIVPYIHATKLHSALDEQKSSNKLVTMEGDGHGWMGDKLEKTLSEMSGFFDQHLKAKK